MKDMLRNSMVCQFLEQNTLFKSKGIPYPERFAHVANVLVSMPDHCQQLKKFKAKDLIRPILIEVTKVPKVRQCK